MYLAERDFPGKGRKIGIVGIPLGFSAGQAGSELGAMAIRVADIRGKRLVEHIKDLGYEVNDYNDLTIDYPAEAANMEDNPKYLPEMLAACAAMSETVRQIFRAGEFPVILGGDHSIAMGTFSGISSFFREEEKEVGLIWFDAHADMNTPETSPSGNLHGMPLSTLLGRGEERLVNLD